MHQYAGGWQTKEQQLIAAVKAHQPQQVRRLLALHADPNARDGAQRETALHAACRFSDGASLALLLLDAGADADAADADGWTAAHWAAYHNAEPTLRLLLSRGAQVHLVNHRGEAPLHWACKNNCARAVRALGTSPAVELERRCARQESARDWAVRHGADEALRELWLLTDAAKDAEGG
ncbi:hypothetical protein AB1Y20_008855 [Prymnesium parvum]|uniref:Uncharacterized protein n=1 Tax=Prymnesium parvum TaxID=97485 RepID=A0AB34IRQ3_PRYPA